MDGECARAVRDATITARVAAAEVYLVPASQGDRPRRVRAELDGHPIAAADGGEDVRRGLVTVRGFAFTIG